MITIEEFPKIIDLSAVQAASTRADVEKTLEVAIQYGCYAIHALPGFIPYVRDHIETLPPGTHRPTLGGPVGFPSGNETTHIKVSQAKELLAFGCVEIDMVMNIAYMKSGMYSEMETDIQAVKNAIGKVPLKVILECHYLTDSEIGDAAKLAVQSGADWIKTATGWAPTGATLENVALIKKAIGDTAQIKAAGGVRNLETVQKMTDLGVERFGISYSSFVKIIDEFR